MPQPCPPRPPAGPQGEAGSAALWVPLELAGSTVKFGFLLTLAGPGEAPTVCWVLAGNWEKLKRKGQSDQWYKKDKLRLCHLTCGA